MFYERVPKCFNILVTLLSELIDVSYLLLLRFHQSMSLMRNQGQLLFDLEYPASRTVLSVHDSYLFASWYIFKFWKNFLSKVRLNRPKFHSLKSLKVLFCKTSERLGSCYFNASLILDEDDVFREIF